MTATDRLEALHSHYACRALAQGHGSECALVTAQVNWPTIMGRPACTCYCAEHGTNFDPTVGCSGCLTTLEA